MDRHPAHEESMYENAARDAQRREVEGLHGRIAEQQAENERLRAKCAEKDAAMASVISAWNGGYVQNHSATMYAAIRKVEKALKDNPGAGVMEVVRAVEATERRMSEMADDEPISGYIVPVDEWERVEKALAALNGDRDAE